MDARYPHAGRGIALMLMAVASFACLDTLSKVLVAHYPAAAIVWIRSVLQTVVMFAIFAPRLGKGLLRSTAPHLQVLRGIVLNASAVLFVMSLAYMPIAEVAAITFLSPVIIALAAGPLLGEKLHPRTWYALAGGLSGVLLIIKPGSAVFAWIALLPLACAFAVAGYQILTRRLAGHDDPVTTLFYPALVGSFLLPLVLPSSLTMPTTVSHAGMIVAIGILGGVGHFLLIKAHALAAASMLAPLSYVQIGFVLFLGWLVFGQIPDGLSLVGILLVAASGLVVILANRPSLRSPR